MTDARPTRRTRIVLGASDGLFRAGVHTLLNHEHDLEVVAETCEAAAVLRRLRSMRPVLPVVVVTAPDDQRFLARADRWGVHGLVAKKGTTAGLLEAIRTVRSGARWVDPLLRRRQDGRDGAQPDSSRNGSAGPKPSGSWERLTARERQVARLVAGGYRYREVARRLSISEHTLKNHLRHIFDKLDIRSRLQLALTQTRSDRRPAT